MSDRFLIWRSVLLQAVGFHKVSDLLFRAAIRVNRWTRY